MPPHCTPGYNRLRGYPPSVLDKKTAKPGVYATKKILQNKIFYARPDLAGPKKNILQAKESIVKFCSFDPSGLQK